MFAKGTLLVVPCLFLMWGTDPSQAAGITCDELWSRFEEHSCDASDLTERCQRIYDRLNKKECLNGAEETTPKPTTKAPTPKPTEPCLALSPGRFCGTVEQCNSYEGSRVLNLLCSLSPSESTGEEVVCCQRQTDAPDCPVGASGGQVTQCLARNDCLVRSGGRLQTQYWCGDGPELCCTYNDV